VLLPTIKISNFYRTCRVFLRGVFLLLACSFLLSFCKYSNSSGRETWNNKELFTAEGYAFPYDLNTVDSEFRLPLYLEEISGLAWYRKGKLACVQDEKANIYILRLEEDIEISKHDFGKDGDYEDIATDGEKIYVLRNDGTIFRIKDLKEKEIKVKKYKTPLSVRNDTEGLAYDPLSGSLFIACKGSPSLDNENTYQGYRAVYRFDLDTKELNEKPHFLVDLNSLNSYRDQGMFNSFSLKLAKKLRFIDSETSFQPSGIAIHPLYGDVYLISSVGKLLIVMDRRGKILDIRELDPVQFRQPEGICFSPEGDLFISSEGQGGKGYILQFIPRSHE
jgi:uncharacterized protein YjiK